MKAFRRACWKAVPTMRLRCLLGSVSRVHHLTTHHWSSSPFHSPKMGRFKLYQSLWKRAQIHIRIWKNLILKLIYQTTRSSIAQLKLRPNWLNSHKLWMNPIKLTSPRPGSSWWHRKTWRISSTPSSHTSHHSLNRLTCLTWQRQAKRRSLESS